MRWFLVAGVLLPALVSLRAAAVPEYLKVQQPIPETLAEIPSSTGNIGVTPESWLEQEAALPPRLRTLLPQWRERYAPHTGQPFFDDMVFLVKPRLYYFQRDIEGDHTSEALAIGGAFSVESGWLNDLLRVNLTGYTSQKLHGPEDRDGTGLLALGQKGYSVLGEAFVELKARRSSIFAGRVPSQLPFINGSDSRMTPNTFEGIGFRTVEIQNLQLGVGHFTKIKPRTSTNFIPMSEWSGVEGVERGVSAIGLRYNFTEDFYIGCINQYGWDMFNTLYLESDHLFTIADDLSLQIGAQFIDQRSVDQELLGSFSTQSTGLRASLGYKSLIASASVTWNAESAGIRHPRHPELQLRILAGLASGRWQARCRRPRQRPHADSGAEGRWCGDGSWKRGVAERFDLPPLFDKSAAHCLECRLTRHDRAPCREWRKRPAGPASSGPWHTSDRR
jgi:hypothetical protein